MPVVSKKLEPYIYREYSNVLQLAEDMRKDLTTAVSDNKKQAQRRKLKEYIDTLLDLQYKNIILTQSNGVVDTLKRNFPDLSFDLCGRFKGFNSFWNKVLYTQNENKSLDTIKDITGLRVITKNASLKTLYEVATSIYNFFTVKGFTPCELTFEIEEFNPEEHPDVELPKQSFLPDYIKEHAKDYVAYPKENGYQSIHFVFYDPSTGRYLEIQNRTSTMDTYAEHGAASHFEYKEGQEQKHETIEKMDVDFSRIKIPGFDIFKLEDGKYSFKDRSGFFGSKSILFRSEDPPTLQTKII